MNLLVVTLVKGVVLLKVVVTSQSDCVPENKPSKQRQTLLLWMLESTQTNLAAQTQQILCSPGRGVLAAQISHHLLP